SGRCPTARGRRSRRETWESTQRRSTEMSAKKSTARSTASETVETRGEAAAPGATVPRRHRRGRKRLAFQVPSKMPLPIKTLWEAASEEQRAIAHRTATAILSTWLGKTSREAAAK